MIFCVLRKDHQTKIFTGPGEVIFDSNDVQRVYPQWWGAKGDGVTNDTDAFAAAAINASIALAA